MSQHPYEAQLRAALEADVSRVTANDPGMVDLDWSEFSPAFPDGPLGGLRDERPPPPPGVMDTHLGRLSQALRGNTHLRTINLSSDPSWVLHDMDTGDAACCVSEAGMQRLAAALPFCNVDRIDFGDTSVSMETQDAAVRLCNANFRRRLPLLLTRVTANDPTLTMIDWSRMGYLGEGEAGVRAAVASLAGALRGGTNTCLRDIDLENSWVNDAALAELEAALPFSMVSGVWLDGAGVPETRGTVLPERSKGIGRCCMQAVNKLVAANDPETQHWGWAVADVPEEMALRIVDGLPDNSHVTALDVYFYDSLDRPSDEFYKRLESVIPLCAIERAGLDPGEEAPPEVKETARAISVLCSYNKAARLAREAHRPEQRLLLATLYARGQDCPNPLVGANLPLNQDVMKLVADSLEASRSHPVGDMPRRRALACGAAPQPHPTPPFPARLKALRERWPLPKLQPIWQSDLPSTSEPDDIEPVAKRTRSSKGRG